jgi:BirA family biotin operon repressor/biotin-[acetyl-CoA-carboxylase] ligase
MGYKPLIEPMYLVELESVASTNDHAKKLAKNGYPSGVIIWAHEQTAGRGRQGNTWVSLPGNLFMTIILRPNVNIAQIGQLSLLIGVALSNVLASFVPAANDIRLKWPNDIYINGKKAGGILIETESQGMLQVPWSVVGIGFNIVDAPEGAISLADVGVTTYEAGHMVEFLSKEINMLVKQWENKGFADIREAWLKRAYKLGEVITARLPKQTLTGVFEGLDKNGALLLTGTDGVRHVINAGEVFA